MHFQLFVSVKFEELNFHFLGASTFLFEGVFGFEEIFHGSVEFLIRLLHPRFDLSNPDGLLGFFVEAGRSVGRGLEISIRNGNFGCEHAFPDLHQPNNFIV